MSYIMVQFKVNDYEKWKEAFDNGHEQRKQHGQSSHQIFQNYDDLSEINILFQWDSLENATSYFEHESLMSSLMEAGVDGKPKVKYLEELEMIRRHIVRKEKFDE